MKRIRFLDILSNDIYFFGKELDLEKCLLMKIESYVNGYLYIKKFFKIVYDVLCLFWIMEKNVLVGSKKLDVFRNLYGFVLQKEFVLSIIYYNDDIFFKFYGLCGLFYFVEWVFFILYDVGIMWLVCVVVVLKLFDFVY